MEMRKRKPKNAIAYKNYEDFFFYKSYERKKRITKSSSNIVVDDKRKSTSNEIEGGSFLLESKEHEENEEEEKCSKVSKYEMNSSGVHDCAKVDGKESHTGDNCDYPDYNAVSGESHGDDPFTYLLSSSDEASEEESSNSWQGKISRGRTTKRNATKGKAAKKKAVKEKNAKGVREKETKKEKNIVEKEKIHVFQATIEEKSEEGKGSKKYNNFISDKFKKFMSEKKEHKYDVDLFSYLSALSGKDERRGRNGFLIFLMSEVQKEIQRSEEARLIEEAYPVDEMQRKQDYHNLYIDGELYEGDPGKKGSQAKNEVNIRKKIEFDCIMNHDNENLRNVFFLENITIHYNNKKVTVFPFKSTEIIERVNTNTKKKKKVHMKNIYSAKEHHLNYDNVYEHVNNIKIGLDIRRESEEYIYINDNYVHLNEDIIAFLYFLLLCNYYFCNNLKEKKKVHRSSDSFNVENILRNMDEYLSRELEKENIFLNLCAPVIYLDFSDSINVVDFLYHVVDANVHSSSDRCHREESTVCSTQLRKNKRLNLIDTKRNEKKVGEDVDMMQNMLPFELLCRCKKLFTGSLLAISVCSYLNNSMFFDSGKKSRNFVFVYFVSQQMGKPAFLDIVELHRICKKVEWVKIGNESPDRESATQDRTKTYQLGERCSFVRDNREYIYLLLCQVGSKIRIYGMSKESFLEQLFNSLKSEHNDTGSSRYIELCLSNTKIKKLFTYKNDELISDFSYSICVKNGKRFLKLAICSNTVKIKIVEIFLSDSKKWEEEVSPKARTVNIPFNQRDARNFLFFPFKRIHHPGGRNLKDVYSSRDNISLGEQINSVPVNAMGAPSDDREMNVDEIVAQAVSGVKEICSESANCTSDENTNSVITNWWIDISEDSLHIQHGILSLCSFYPCVNSFLLCISTKEGDIIIMDIRNSNELFYFKRKTESISHLRWYSNSCISFGQDKGCIIHLFENKYFLNIDKTWNNFIEIICLHSCIINNMYMFIFDDGTIIKGKLKKSPSKIKPKEIILWTTSTFELDPEVLLKISSIKNDQIESMSLILLYEYLQGLQNIFNNGIEMRKSKLYEANVSRRVIALTPKSISFANFDKNFVTAYGNACGLIHIFSGEKDA
ncbi:conserved Plasmodium protein, unknown function [Plasmodium ovale]|uniref:Uncharacterized protein n=2 Tax=Plasmodium ovale TaxID=36330 RepID=A0A1A8W919_PLAOA|nr:conserved Plasmodium protein, unknown function [Plasmodium ovale curtisi]SBS92444.1 conserved Plasmodium protein, unknown function [Plasmodium ovale curtisi]SCQ16425.1 conserved Plasmodium protein, unknown function [Plasmodium ovale]